MSERGTPIDHDVAEFRRALGQKRHGTKQAPGDAGAIKEPICFACAHLIYWPYCEAFPDGIPDAIRLAESDHQEPMQGDHGVQFERAQVLGEKGSDRSGNWGHTSEQRRGVGRGGSDPGGGLAAIGLPPGANLWARRRASQEHRYYRGRLGLPTAVTAETVRGIFEVQAKGIGSGREHGYGIDQEGKKIDGTVEGDKESVNLEPISGTGKSFVIVHSHPNSKSFSPHDVSQIMNGYADHIIAVGHDGTVYRMSRTDKTPSPDDFARILMERIADNLREEAAALTRPQKVLTVAINDWRWYYGNHQWEIQDKVRTGKLTNQEANRQHAHLAMVDLAAQWDMDYAMVEPPWKK